MPSSVDASLAKLKVEALRASINEQVLLRTVGLRVMGWVAQNFRQGGIERKWQPLSANTIAARRRNSDRPLQDTGRLRMSFTESANNPKITANTVYITSNVKYAPYHEFGTRPYTITPKNKKFLAFKTASGMRFAKKVNHPGIPQRKMLPSLPLARQLATTTIKAAILKRARGK